MNGIILAIVLCVLTLSVGQAAGAEPQAQSDVGKFVIVPAGNTASSADKMPIRFSAWRLNTETGDVEFCSYTGGAVAPGGITSESLRCISAVPAVKPHEK